MSFFICIIATMFNFFMLELMIREEIGQNNQINSPLGIDMSAIIIAYNYTNNQIPGSMSRCDNKLQCLQLMCTMKHIPHFNTMKIFPIPVTWSNKCDLTVTNSICDIYEKSSVLFITSFIMNIIALIGSAIGCIIIYSSNDLKSNYSKYGTMITILHFMYVLYSISCILIVTISIETIRSSSITDYEISGMNYYDKFHNLFSLCIYIFINVLLLIKILLDAKKLQQSLENNSELLPSID